MSDIASRLHAAKEDGDLEAYGQLRRELLDKPDDELRRLAEADGVDGVDGMDREHLLERLLEEPGTTEA